jgi:hypothetical protein
MSWKPHFAELQNQILRSIFRSLDPDGRSSPTKAQITRAENLKVTAAQLFAARNGWQYQPELYSWCDLESFAFSPHDKEQLRSLVFEPLLFVDERGVPAAFASQPRRQERCDMDRDLARKLGLRVSSSPALYASIAEPGWRQFLVFTPQRLPVRWLPEQEERHSHFAVHLSDAPNFHVFLEEHRSADQICQEELDRLLHLRNYRRWAPPAEIVSFCHFKSYVHGLVTNCIDDDMAAAIWSEYETWSNQHVSSVLQFDKDIGEAAW